MAVPQLKSEVSWKCNLLQILLAFEFRLDRKQKGAFDSIREEVTTAGAKRLRSLRDMLDTNIRIVAKDLGLKGRPEAFYRNFIEHMFKERLAYGYVPKYVLDGMFTNVLNGIPDWNSYPAQTLVGFDFGGDYDLTKTFEYFLPEIVLYEEMCLAWNQAILSKHEPAPGKIDRVRSKTYKFYVHTAVLSAFYFVEAYLNGIAFDFYSRTKGDRQLSKEEIEKLTEYDSQHDRERWISFRDKMLQYPKIILGAKEPPLTEGNCEEIRILTSEAKALRDSLVHNSPRIEEELVEGKMQLIGKRVRSILLIDLDEAVKIVDAAVRLPKRVNALLQGHHKGQVLDWLYERDETGLFPAKVFE